MGGAYKDGEARGDGAGISRIANWRLGTWTE